MLIVRNLGIVFNLIGDIKIFESKNVYIGKRVGLKMGKYIKEIK